LSIMFLQFHRRHFLLSVAAAALAGWMYVTAIAHPDVPNGHDVSAVYREKTKFDPSQFHRLLAEHTEKTKADPSQLRRLLLVFREKKETLYLAAPEEERGAESCALIPVAANRLEIGVVRPDAMDLIGAFSRAPIMRYSESFGGFIVLVCGVLWCLMVLLTQTSWLKASLVVLPLGLLLIICTPRLFTRAGAGEYAAAGIAETVGEDSGMPSAPDLQYRSFSSYEEFVHELEAGIPPLTQHDQQSARVLFAEHEEVTGIFGLSHGHDRSIVRIQWETEAPMLPLWLPNAAKAVTDVLSITDSPVTVAHAAAEYAQRFAKVSKDAEYSADANGAVTRSVPVFVSESFNSEVRIANRLVTDLLWNGCWICRHIAYADHVGHDGISFVDTAPVVERARSFWAAKGEAFNRAIIVFTLVMLAAVPFIEMIRRVGLRSVALLFVGLAAWGFACVEYRLSFDLPRIRSYDTVIPNRGPWTWDPLREEVSMNKELR